MGGKAPALVLKKNSAADFCPFFSQRHRSTLPGDPGSSRVLSGADRTAGRAAADALLWIPRGRGRTEHTQNFTQSPARPRATALPEPARPRPQPGRGRWLSPITVPEGELTTFSPITACSDIDASSSNQHRVARGLSGWWPEPTWSP